MTIIQNWRSAVAGLASLLLFACGTTPPAYVSTTGYGHPPLSSFSVSGKLAWQDSGKGDSVRFQWDYQQPQIRLDLLTPLGSVAAHVDASPGNVVMETAKGDRLTATSLEALSTRVFELTLPLSGLEYWVQGLPIPDQPFTEEALPGGKRLHQGGWQLDYPSWTQVNGVSLPLSLDMQQGDVTLRLRLHDWNLTPGTP